MATIEQRAREYATKLVGGEYQGGFKGDVWLDLYSKYIEIATEQRKVDIKKACEWLYECVGIGEEFKKTLVGKFRKAMEEKV